MKVNKTGGTRIVIITKRYAIKFPRFNSWMAFVQGMLSNMTEGQWKDYPDKHLCPIHYSNRFGLIVVMARAKEIENEGLFWCELESLYHSCSLNRDFYEYDAFPKNFGYYNGRLVKIDYGV